MADLNFDVTILGTGPAGEVCAGRLADDDPVVAIVGEVRVDRRWHVVPPCPTRDEAWLGLPEGSAT